MALCADFPQVLAKVRAEQLRLRPNNEKVTGDLLNKMVYTRQASWGEAHKRGAPP